MSENIQYLPDLIAEFESDHRDLLKLYGRLVDLVAQKNFTTFQKEMLTFKSMLVSHLLKEAVKLYIYLRQQFKDDPSIYSLVTAYKTEMDGIGGTVIKFIDKYAAKSAGHVNFVELGTELHEIGAVLGERVGREEQHLYPLYHQNY